jgi:F0F1-type ATP synthase membrane subunit b/b'
MQRMADDIRRLPAAMDTTRAHIEKSTKDAKAMRDQAQQPFQHSAELEHFFVS